MKIAFMFSGQGAQYVGMGKELYDQFPICKQVYDTADALLDFSVTSLCFAENDLLNKTEFTQPALLTTSVACMKLLMAQGIMPDYVLGLSLGEYTALVAGGVLAFEDAVPLVRKRGKFMTEAVPDGVGAMSAIMGLDRDVVNEVCEQSLHIGFICASNYNAPGQIVIAGVKEAVEEAEKRASEKGAKRVIRLNVSGAFHTKLLEPASVKLGEELDKIEIHDMKIPVLTNLTGDCIQLKDDVKQTLMQQVMSPVKWEDSIQTLLALGVDTFIELGPSKTLSSFVKKINKDVTILNVEDIKSFEKTCKGLGITGDEC